MTKNTSVLVGILIFVGKVLVKWKACQELTSVFCLRSFPPRCKSSPRLLWQLTQLSWDGSMSGTTPTLSARMALTMPILTILYQKESKGKEGDRDNYPCNLLIIEGGSYNFVGRNYRYVILNQACLFSWWSLCFPLWCYCQSWTLFTLLWRYLMILAKQVLSWTPS